MQTGRVVMTEEDVLKKLFLVREDLETIFPFHPASYDRLIKQGKFPRPIKMASRVVWPREDIQEFIRVAKEDRGEIYAPRGPRGKGRGRPKRKVAAICYE
jgi:predicted DNA-binding transcriptional regulator AlpA